MASTSNSAAAAGTNASNEAENQEPLSVEELARPFNIPTDGNPFDIDAILDAIPEDRKGRKYTDGWDPERLDEELAQHPFFMKELPKEGEPLPPLLQGLQQLKYSEDDNTCEELALNYKEDGLFHYKLKKYRIATACFTEALRKATSEDNPEIKNELVAQLYNNRAAAQFHLENYRSSLMDCERAIKYKDDYFKPVFKAIECAVKLGKYKKALDFCERAEKLQPTNSEVQRLRLLAIRKQKVGGAADRKNEFKRRAKLEQFRKTMAYVTDRGIRCRSSDFLNEDSEPGRHVKIGEDDRLEWPVLFYYPQFSQSDFIEAFHEDATFVDHLTEILENDRPAWDRHNEYHLGTVTVYFIDFATGGYIQVNKESTIGQVLQDKRFLLPNNGIPTFFIMSTENEMCKMLLERVQSASDS